MEKKVRDEMRKIIVEGPVYDLEQVKQAVREGRVQMMGTPPDLSVAAPDFTVTSTDLLGDITINWQTVSAGFGQIAFYHKEEDGKLHCMNEGMDKAFIRSVINKMIDDCILDDEKE